MKIFIIALFIISNSLFALEKVSLQLHWKYQFEFAGFIMAKEKGFYKDAGLDVTLKEYCNGINIVDSVLNGESTYGIYNSNILISYIHQKPIKLISSFFKRPALVILTQPNIKTPQELIGKKVMTTSKKDFDFNFKYMFDKNRVDTDNIKFIPNTYSVNEFANGEVDAITAFISSEPYELDKKNIKYNIIDPSDYGLYNLQLELFTSKKEVSKHPARVEAFRKATIKGWEYALNHQKETIDIIYNRYSHNIDKQSLQEEARITKRLILPDIYKVGSIDYNFLHRQFEIFMNDLHIHKNVNLKNFIFNRHKHTVKNIKFTQVENQFLSTIEELTACVDPSWMPFEGLQEGKHIGLSSDYLKIFSQNLNIPIRVIPTKSWSQTLEFAKERVCDILPLVTKTAQREKFLNFTSPLIKTPIVIVTKLNTTFVADIHSIKGKKLGIPKGYALADKLTKKYSYLNIIEVPTTQDGMEMVKDGELYGVIGSLGVIGYVIQRKYFGQLKINGKFNEYLSVPMGLRDDEPLLQTIFQKLIDNLSSSQHNHIFDKWVSQPIEKKFDYTIVYKTIAFSLFIISILIFFFHKEKKLKNSLSEIVANKTLTLQQQNKQLHHLIRQFQDLLDATLEVIVLSDENKKIIDINLAGIKLFKASSKEDIIGMNILDLFPPDELEGVLHALSNNTQNHYELTIKDFEGKPISILAGGKDSLRDGKKIRISSIIDITALKKKDQQLLEQAKLAQMGEMISMIAHQWRQPLNAISAKSIQLSLRAKMNRVETSNIIENSEFIQDQCQKMSKTIDTFMNFAKPTYDNKTFNPAKSIQSILNVMGAQLKNHNITIDILSPTEDIYIFGNENLLEQVVINILSNSRDAFESSTIQDRSITIEIENRDNIPKIIITDNAGGVPKHIIDKIFNPYFTTKEQGKGTGIGLYMSKDIMRKSFSGDLIYKGKENGSCFELLFGGGGKTQAKYIPKNIEF